MAKTRKKVPKRVAVAVLTEAGYRCAVPTCRNILAIDLHHIVEVAEGGGNEIANLIALCPTCHSLFHRGVISRDSIYAWKSILVALSQAFDRQTIDDLLFLDKLTSVQLMLSADGVLRFSRVIAADLAELRLGTAHVQYGYLYNVVLSPKGRLLIDAWKKGNRAEVAAALGVDPADYLN
jgi:HNH endonuclease